MLSKVDNSKAVNIKRKILIIDDSRPTREIFKFYLDKAGYNVYEAENSSDAYLILSEIEDFFLVIIDYYLPDCDGVEIAKYLRTNHPNIPICGVSLDKNQLNEFVKYKPDILIHKDHIKNKIYDRVIPFLLKREKGII